MQASVLHFDRFDLDLSSYELHEAGRLVKLERLPKELLVLLAESPGQLVTRERIIQRLWGDNIYVDTRQGINTAVRKLRVALHDESEHPRFLQTVAGRGYGLLVPVSSTAVASGWSDEGSAPGCVVVESAHEDSRTVNARGNFLPRRWLVLIACFAAVFLSVGVAIVFRSSNSLSNSVTLKDWRIQNGDWSADGRRVLTQSATRQGVPVILELSSTGKMSVVLEGSAHTKYWAMLPSPDGKYGILNVEVPGDNNAWTIDLF